MDAKLIVVGGDAVAAEYALALPAVIGRSRSASIKVPQPLVSRRHCEIYEEQGQLVVRDLGSLNGTYVGSDRITEDTVLPPGGLLTVGSITFKAEYIGPETTDDNTLEFGQTVHVAKSASKSGPSPKADPGTASFDEPPLEFDEPAEAGEAFPWLQESEPSQDLAAPSQEPQWDDPAELELDLTDQPADQPGIATEEPFELAEPVDSVPTSGDLETVPLETADAAADEGQRFAAPENPPGAGDEEDLDDFFRSLDIKK